jgi:hypothetical protein
VGKRKKSGEENRLRDGRYIEREREREREREMNKGRVK